MKFMEKIFENVIYGFSWVIVFVLMFCNAIFTTCVQYDSSEKVLYYINPISIVFTVFIFVILFFAFHIIKKTCENKLFIIFSVVYIIFSLFIILNLDSYIRADAQSVANSALNFIQGDYSSLQPNGYLGIHPHQLGLTTYESILLAVFDNEKVFYLTNALAVILINWLGYRIVKITFNNSDINKMMIFLEFMFLPQFFYIMFAYGLTPGFCCMMISLYFMIKFIKQKKLIYSIVSIFFIAMATLLKMNFLIGAIAIAVELFVYFFKEKKPKYLVLIAGIFAAIVFSGEMLDVFYTVKSGSEIPKGAPTNLYIAMGTDLENEMRAPGWYNCYNYTTFVNDANLDTEVASQMANEKILDNLNKIKAQPLNAAKFFSKKVISIWCDPLYQSVWSGPSIDIEEHTDNKIIISIYSGGLIERACKLFMESYIQLLLVAAFLFLIWQSKKYPELNVMYIYLIGGFLFHIFWEGKSQYVYPYVFVLIPMLAFELVQIYNKIIYRNADKHLK